MNWAIINSLLGRKIKRYGIAKSISNCAKGEATLYSQYNRRKITNQ